MFCPHCGNETDQLIALAAPAVAVASDDVEIARINAERDIRVAELARSETRSFNETQVEVAEVEAAADVEVATAQAEILGDAIEAAAAGDPAPEETETAPVEIPDPGPSEADLLAPPEAESHRAPAKSSAMGWNFG